MKEFKPFAKIPRYSRPVIITEKIDGTNASIHINLVEDQLNGPILYTDFAKDYRVQAASKNRVLGFGKEDNFGFAKWVEEHARELIEGLGVGSHYGEWWGQGIQRGYGLKEKRFSLFNVHRWITNWREYEGGVFREQLINDKQQYAPICCDVVPIIHQGIMGEIAYEDHPANSIQTALSKLYHKGSYAAPGYMKPEGIVIYHSASGYLFKKTLEDDEKPKGLK